MAQAINQLIVRDTAQPGQLVLRRQMRETRPFQRGKKNLSQEISGIMFIGDMLTEIGQDSWGMPIIRLQVSHGEWFFGSGLLHTFPHRFLEISLFISSEWGKRRSRF